MRGKGSQALEDVLKALYGRDGIFGVSCSLRHFWSLGYDASMEGHGEASGGHSRALTPIQ